MFRNGFFTQAASIIPKTAATSLTENATTFLRMHNASSLTNLNPDNAFTNSFGVQSPLNSDQIVAIAVALAVLCCICAVPVYRLYKRCCP